MTDPATIARGLPPKDGTVFYAVIRVPMKWKPYKPNSEQSRKGIKGRWVESNGYGGWNPAAYQPEEWEPVPPGRSAPRTAGSLRNAASGAGQGGRL